VSHEEEAEKILQVGGLVIPSGDEWSGHVKRIDHLESQLVILSKIAKRKMQGCALRRAWLRLTHWNLPFLWYFRGRFDRKVVLVYGLGACIFFFYVVGSTTPFHWRVSPWSVVGSFVIMSIGFLWIFSTSLFAQRLRRIEALFKKTTGELVEENRKWKEREEDKIRHAEKLDRDISLAVAGANGHN
jgi:hypothetical protein